VVHFEVTADNQDFGFVGIPLDLLSEKSRHRTARMAREGFKPRSFQPLYPYGILIIVVAAH